MKKFITTSIFVLFWVVGLKAQDNITVPIFSQNAVCFCISRNISAGNIVFYFYDGGKALPEIKIKETNKTYFDQILPQATHVINELIKQGYDLISVTEYIYYFTKK